MCRDLLAECWYEAEHLATTKSPYPMTMLVWIWKSKVCCCNNCKSGACWGANLLFTLLILLSRLGEMPWFIGPTWQAPTTRGFMRPCLAKKIHSGAGHRKPGNKQWIQYMLDISLFINSSVQVWNRQVLIFTPTSAIRIRNGPNHAAKGTLPVDVAGLLHQPDWICLHDDSFTEILYICIYIYSFVNVPYVSICVVLQTCKLINILKHFIDIEALWSANYTLLQHPATIMVGNFLLQSKPSFIADIDHILQHLLICVTQNQLVLWPSISPPRASFRQNTPGHCSRLVLADTSNTYTRLPTQVVPVNGTGIPESANSDIATSS